MYWRAGAQDPCAQRPGGRVPARPHQVSRDFADACFPSFYPWQIIANGRPVCHAEGLCVDHRDLYSKAGGQLPIWPHQVSRGWQVVLPPWCEDSHFRGFGYICCKVAPMARSCQQMPPLLLLQRFRAWTKQTPTDRGLARGGLQQEQPPPVAQSQQAAGCVCWHAEQQTSMR